MRIRASCRTVEYTSTVHRAGTCIDVTAVYLSWAESIVAECGPFWLDKQARVSLKCFWDDAMGKLERVDVGKESPYWHGGQCSSWQCARSWNLVRITESMVANDWIWRWHCPRCISLHREWLVYSEDEVQSKNFIVLNTEGPKALASKLRSGKLLLYAMWDYSCTR